MGYFPHPAAPRPDPEPSKPSLLPQYVVAFMLILQAANALYQGVTVITPACADFTQRLNDQFNSALFIAALLYAGGFWRRNP